MKKGGCLGHVGRDSNRRGAGRDRLEKIDRVLGFDPKRRVLAQPGPLN